MALFGQTAIDNEGKSPLAVCLECRMNDWSGTAKLLREAYRTAVSWPILFLLLGHLNSCPPLLSSLPKSPDTLLQSPSLLSHPPPSDHTPSFDSSPLWNGMGPLDYRGSQASLSSKATATGKRGKKVSHYGPLRETLSIDHLYLSVCLSVSLSVSSSDGASAEG